jgi:molybdopterin converting factor small subunit
MVKGLNTEEVLATLADIRRRMPKASTPRPKKKFEDTATARAVGGTMEDFEDAAMIDALEELTDELGAMLDEKRAKLMEQALEVYYTAEELAKDPAHAELIPHVAKMREAYERDNGKPIPPRPEKKKE